MDVNIFLDFQFELYGTMKKKGADPMNEMVC